MLSFSASALAYNAGSRSVVLTGRRAPAAAMVDCLENAMVYDRPDRHLCWRLVWLRLLP